MNEHPAPALTRRDTERHILVAVNESDNAKRAVMYLADFFGDYRNVFITLLTILPEPEEDYFADDKEKEDWLREKKRNLEECLSLYRGILLDAGFKEDRLTTQLLIRPCSSIGDAILEEQDKLRCCIVVVGRRGLSHNEEFIFGSTSSRILHQAKNCAVMVVE